jgi:hypothetical protein
MLSNNFDSLIARCLISRLKFASSEIEIAEEKIPTRTRYEDKPTNEIVTSPKGGY